MGITIGHHRQRGRHPTHIGQYSFHQVRYQLLLNPGLDLACVVFAPCARLRNKLSSPALAGGARRADALHAPGVSILHRCGGLPREIRLERFWRAPLAGKCKAAADTQVLCACRRLPRGRPS